MFRSVATEAVRRCTHKFNPICRRFLSGTALGAKFEVVVRVVSAIEVTLRHHRVAFQAEMFMRQRRSPAELIAIVSPARLAVRNPKPAVWLPNESGRSLATNPVSSSRLSFQPGPEMYLRSSSTSN
jgi:hypothetical protein